MKSRLEISRLGAPVAYWFPAVYRNREPLFVSAELVQERDQEIIVSVCMYRVRDKGKKVYSNTAMHIFILYSSFEKVYSSFITFNLLHFSCIQASTKQTI